MAALELFNAAIDRYDRRSAARLFDLLWPDPSVSRAIAANIAASIRAAHAVSDRSWEVTMFAHALRLNVGQVETLSLWDDEVLFVFREPLVLESGHGIEVSREDDPVFPAVPIPSGVCSVPATAVPALPQAVRDAHEAYILAAATLKRVSPFKSSHSPAVLEYVESILGVALPRPGYAAAESMGERVVALPDEVEDARPLLEGAGYQVTVNAYERDPRARLRCVAEYGTACAICGFSFGAYYGPVADGFIHVHHLRPLSEIGGEYRVNPVEDLRPVCPNCHAVLHRRVPAYSIEEVRSFIEKKRND